MCYLLQLLCADVVPGLYGLCFRFSLLVLDGFLQGGRVPSITSVTYHSECIEHWKCDAPRPQAVEALALAGGVAGKGK